MPVIAKWCLKNHIITLKKSQVFNLTVFIQGIAEMASCGEDSRFEILEVSDPDSLLVRGESHDVNIKDCKELARLQSL